MAVYTTYMVGFGFFHWYSPNSKTIFYIAQPVGLIYYPIEVYNGFRDEYQRSFCIIGMLTIAVNSIIYAFYVTLKNMDTTKNITMVQPIPNPEFDFNKIIEVLIAVGGFLWATLSYMGKYFKDKALERDAKAMAEKVQTEDFIQKVAIACVKATLDSVLGDVKKDIDQLFKYRDEDKKHWDDRFDKVITEIKK